MTFEYTEIFDDFESSVIEGVYYNENTNFVALDIKGEVYVYEVDSRKDVLDLVNSPSVGKAYHHFQNKFGPSDHIGVWRASLFKKVEHTPIEWRTGNDFTSGIVVNSASINIGSSGVVGLPRRYEIVFTVEDSQVEKTYSLVAQSETDAVKSLKSVGDSLDLKFKIKRVTAFYE